MEKKKKKKRIRKKKKKKNISMYLKNCLMVTSACNKYPLFESLVFFTYFF